MGYGDDIKIIGNLEYLRHPSFFIFDAIENGNVEAVKELIARDRSVLDITEKYDTPLHTAFKFVNLEMVEVMLNNGADMFAVDGFGRLPIHCAVVNDPVTSLKLVKLVVSLFSDSSKKKKELVELLNTPDELFGLTPLHYAVRFSYCNPTPNLELVRLLLKNGANPVPDTDNVYPSEMCADEEVKKLLKKHETRKKRKQAEKNW